MRALDKNLQVTSYWFPFGFNSLLDDKDETENGNELASEVDDDEDKGSIFNDTASMHSISKHSWHSRSMQSPRSIGSQSPYHAVNMADQEADNELASIIRDVGPGVANDIINRVPSPGLGVNVTSKGWESFGGCAWATGAAGSAKLRPIRKSLSKTHCSLDLQLQLLKTKLKTKNGRLKIMAEG